MDNSVDKVYQVCVLDMHNGKFYGILPDFSLSCFEASLELVLDKLFIMASSFISLAKGLNEAIPSPTSDEIIKSNWAEFLVLSLTLKV